MSSITHWLKTASVKVLGGREDGAWKKSNGASVQQLAFCIYSLLFICLHDTWHHGKEKNSRMWNNRAQWKRGRAGRNDQKFLSRYFVKSSHFSLCITVFFPRVNTFIHWRRERPPATWTAIHRLCSLLAGQLAHSLPASYLVPLLAVAAVDSDPLSLGGERGKIHLCACQRATTVVMALQRYEKVR